MIERIAIGVFAAASILFLGVFELNLHCTQDTSFRVATFDMEPHAEEGLSEALPAVYGRAAIPLRIYLGGAILALWVFPPLGAAAVARERMRRTVMIAVSLVLWAIVFANTILPKAIAGERFQALNIAAWLLVLPPLVFLIATTQRRSERKSS